MMDGSDFSSLHRSWAKLEAARKLEVSAAAFYADRPTLMAKEHLEKMRTAHLKAKEVFMAEMNQHDKENT